MMKKQLLALSICAVLGLASSASIAADASGALTLSLTLTEESTVDTSGLSGNIGTKPVGGDWGETSIGDVSITCTSGLSYMWGIGGGSHFGQDTSYNTDPAMQSGSKYIAYNITTGAGAGSEIGDAGMRAASGNNYTETYTKYNGVSATGTGSAQTTTIYLLPLGESNNSPGTYSDTNTITVVWQ